MDYYNKIATHFQSTIKDLSMAVDALAKPIHESAKIISDSLINGNKVMVCGFGADAALAQLFVSQSQSSLEEERPGLPMVALTINEYEHDQSSTAASDLYGTALKSLGLAGDVLLCIDSNLNSSNLLGLINLAISKKIKVVILSGSMQENYSSTAKHSGVSIIANAKNRVHLVELFTVTLQCLSLIIDDELFGDNQ